MKKKWKFFLLIIVIILIFAGCKFYINWTKVNALEEQMELLETKIENVEEKNEKLKENLKEMDESEYVERIAREKLGLVKRGEILLIPVEND